MVILKFEGVWKNFTEEGSALAGIDLEVKQGEFAALAGPSGSGKSTLLNLAAGLDVPTRGKVFLMGRDLGGLSSEKLALLRSRCLGFVFQSYNLIPVLTVAENVEFPLALNEVGVKARRESIRAALEAVGVGDLARRYPRELSGGQQQRVAVARAIVHRPKIVLGDEPTANLDRRNVEQMMELFAQLNSRWGITFLLTSHDPRVLERTPRKVELVDGKMAVEKAVKKSREETTPTPKRGSHESHAPNRDGGTRLPDPVPRSRCERVV